MIPTLIVTGSGPGTGKSTVAGRLHTVLERRSMAVHCFYETDVLNIAEFQTFFGLFRSADRKMVPALQHALDAYLAEHLRDDAVFVSDSLVPFVRWLILGEVPDDDILAFCAWLEGRLKSRAPTLIVLRCSPEAGLARAARSRGDDWIEQWRRRESDYPLYRSQPGTDRSVVFEREAAYFDALGWTRVDRDTERQSVEDIVSDVLDRYALLPETAGHRVAIVEGEYVAVDTDAAIPGFRVANDRIELMGSVLALVGRADGAARLERSNSTLIQVGGELLLDSSRFGRRRYRKLSQ